eukprot:GEMP01049450.1.p2 GENE.GEMP01049450.1~~GEMP01049450.1.p2  ORF type:complete len:246 (+),score=71.02 GEMP01049450.1:304-1041(+)
MGKSRGGSNAAGSHRANQMNPNNPAFAAATNNRANQLNPSSGAYLGSRAAPTVSKVGPTFTAAAAKVSSQPAGPQNQSNQPKAPNQPASRSNQPKVSSQPANRSNQLNPQRDAYWTSRGIAPGKVETVYHGTSKSNAALIQSGGFKPSPGGLLGQGVYVTTDKDKATSFARGHSDGGVVLKAQANFGSVKSVDARNARAHNYSENSWKNTHDAAFCPSGEGVRRPEHCVTNPQRVAPCAKKSRLD